MPSTELYKKALSTAIFVTLASAVVILVKTFKDGLRSLLDEGSMSLQMFDTVVKILYIILGMLIVIAVVRVIAFVLMSAATHRSTQKEVSSLLKTVFSIVAYILAFFIIFQSVYPDISLAPLFTGSTILGIVVGLALQDTLGNLFAGIALQADRSFEVGDVINITNRGAGVVESVSWRGVKIRTFQNKLLVISNAVLGKESIEVAPKGNLNARLVYFNTTYSESPAHVANLVREAIRLSENVSPKLRPIVRIRNLGDSSIEWEVKYWLEDYAKYNDADALVRQRIWYLFNREKIDFAFPTRTLHMEPRLEIPPGEVFNAIIEHLNSVSLFTPLSDEEIEKLANASTTRVYAPGEAIVRIGQPGHAMFVIIRGEVKIQIPEKSYQKTIGTLYENDFFGEMSLLTGEPRTANVIAVEETEVLRIEKITLKPIFEHNPALVESICELVEERKVFLKVEAEDDADGHSETKKGVMRSIRKFFGLK